MPAILRRAAALVLDSGPVLVLAGIAAAGSFTHIHDTAADHGQRGWMAWAIAICVDLMCVMAARERHRDQRHHRRPRGPVSWPTLVLTGGVLLSLAANLAQAEHSVWGWITAATPAAAFLVAVSMLERRATPHPAADQPESTPAREPEPAPVPEATPAVSPTPAPVVRPGLGGLAPALVEHARRIAADHQAATGRPVTPEVLRARLGIPPALARSLLAALTV